MAFDRNNTAAASLMPAQAEAKANCAAPSDDGCHPIPVSERGERLLYRLAQSELVHLTSQLTALCREAAVGRGSDRERLETLQHLAQRLDVAGTVLAELGGEVSSGEKTEPRNLLQLIQDLGRALEGMAQERRIVIAVDIAGAVRRLVPAAVSPLLRLMFESAIRATAPGGRIDIVTRREGETAAVSATLSAIRTPVDSFDASVLDLAILRNLAVRQGGRLAIVHCHALGRQWVLRLPLGADFRAAGGLEMNLMGSGPLGSSARSSYPALLPNEDS